MTIRIICRDAETCPDGAYLGSRYVVFALPDEVAKLAAWIAADTCWHARTVVGAELVRDTAAKEEGNG